jgi:hypothetical protein
LLLAEAPASPRCPPSVAPAFPLPARLDNPPYLFGLPGIATSANGTHNGEANGPPSEIREQIRKAVRIATHAETTGDPRGAWEAYHCAARLILAAFSKAEAGRDRLRAALEESAPSFEEHLSLLREACGEVAGPCDAGPPPRGASDALAEIRAWVAHAISLGAPADNHGDQRGCYEVYAATARLLLRSVRGADDARG